MAGPLASVTLAGLFALAGWTVAGPAGDLLAWLFVGNLVVAAFNLLPGFPLDGGRVARALVWRLTGRRLLATRVTARGRALAAVLVSGRGRRRPVAVDPPLAAPGRPRPVPVAGRHADGEPPPGRRPAARRAGRARVASCPCSSPPACARPTVVEVADVRRVSDLLARLEVLPGRSW